MAYEQKHIEGDAVVGHDAVVGGDLKVNGRGHFKGNVRIDGWLDCPNIAGPHKGFFSTEAELRAAHPSPQEGWVAVVGDNPPAGKVYRVNKGQWTNTNNDSTGSLDGDVNAYSKQVGALASDLQELSAKLSHATVTQVAPLYDNNGNLVIETERNDGTYEEIPFPKATSERDGIMSKEDKQSLEHLALAIEKEQERAVAEEERLSKRIDLSEEKDKELCLAIKQEQTRAESAEKINANAISAEEKRATNAECHLGHGVTEAHRRIDEILQRYARPSSLEQELKETQQELEEAQNDIAALQDEVSDLPEIRKDIEKSQKDIEVLYRGTQDLPEIRKNLSDAQEDIESGKKEVASIKKTVESLVEQGVGPGGGGASIASAVGYDNAKTGFAAANVQDAIDESTEKVSELNGKVELYNQQTILALGELERGQEPIPVIQEAIQPAITEIEVTDDTRDAEEVYMRIKTIGSPEPELWPIGAASESKAGVMTAADKVNLDGSLRAVGFGYNENSELELWAMENGENQRSPIVVPAASETSSGVMTAADKKKLDELGGSTFTPLGEDEITAIFNNFK